ncbi:efflux RND transporter periplasmic adaptor subunit [Geomonas sp. Red32]|uniref:efflux RND transporter periplasmic adaptor subunit n=1 Tax=Geomonas sp. Red32 TaxID=2912856 RepID=UPI00202CDB23|nr:efflux RND transporter periplasmic adaptor subunit [Geomonas sp. Red32]MCM0084369.1 efflux RND transporter periplasmic adaptor subunit [Geomonas sp. Red32]
MNVRYLLRFVITIAVVASAALISRTLWQRYMDSPWTRDGRVRADVVNVAADVSGVVVGVSIKDNQLVHKGDLLFTVDRERYRLALEQAKSRLAASEAVMRMRQDQAGRRAELDGIAVSEESRDDARSQAESAVAACQEAAVAVETAKLNLERAEVRAPVDGYVTNMNVHRGDFATAGVAKLALIDKKSFWVYGYFEETKLHLLHPGDQVEIRLLGNTPPLKGHIESFSHGITDHDNPTGRELLSDVNPVFNWVRLAQRIPVRIRLDKVPDNAPLAAGMTCTVVARPPAAHPGT